MHILIVGAGIAATALAAHLEQQGGWTVHLAGQPRRSDDAEGVVLWQNALRILEDLQLLEPLESRARTADIWQLRNADDRVLNTVEFASEDGMEDLLTMRRSDLLEVLCGGLDDAEIDRTARVSGIEPEEEKTTVIFEDHRSEAYDLVVAADGIDSTVRKLAFDGWTSETFDDVSIHLPITAGDEAALDHPVQWFGQGGASVVALPVAGAAAAHAVLPFNGEPNSVDARELLRQQSGQFPTPIGRLFDQAHHRLVARPNREVKVGNWYNERVLLIGDAAHGLHPLVGIGPTLALEDARLLYELLADKAPDHLEVALRRFQARRMTRLRRFRRLSYVTRKSVLTRSPLAASMRDFMISRSAKFAELLVSDVDPVGGGRRTPS